MAASGRVKSWVDLAKKNFTVPAAWDRHRDAPEGSTAFHVFIKTVEGVPPKAPKGSTEYRLHVSLFDVTYKQFFGRTWVGPPVQAKAVGQKTRINYSQNVYFHSSLNDTSIIAVVEIIAVTHVGDGKMQQVSCGWGMFRPFKYEGDMLDMASANPAPVQRIDIYHGSPRGLLYLDEPLESNSQLTLVNECQVLYTIQTHRHMARVLHLIPENVFVGSNDVIPGLAEPQRDPKNPGLDYLRKPRQLKAMPSFIEKLTVTLTPSLEKLEEEMCRQLNEDRINRENKVADGTVVSIVERRLQVGVHNGWCYVDKPEVIHLGGESGGSKGSSLRRSTRGHQRTPSTGSLGSAVTTLVHRNRIQLDGMVEDPNFVVVFVLEYVLGEPVQAKDRRASMAQSSTFTVALRWAAWSPFANLHQEEQVVGLAGGPAPLPDAVFVYNSGESVGSSSSLATQEGGTVSFEFKLLKKPMTELEQSLSLTKSEKAQQSFGGVASSSALNVPQLNLPESVRAPSQQSLTENGALQEVQVPGRPPIPSRSFASLSSDTPRTGVSDPPVLPRGGTSMMSSSGHQPMGSPHPDFLGVPGQQGAQMFPSTQAYAQPSLYGSSPSPYGTPSPYYGAGPYSTAPVYHPSPRGYIPVEITHVREPSSPMSTAQPGMTVGDLQELPFTPVHAPIMASLPGRHSGQGLSRSAYAKLYTAGFPTILDQNGEPPEVVDPVDHLNFVLSKEENDRLQANEVILQFLAYSRTMMFDALPGAKQPATVFFTFQFYRFPQVTTERLLLGNVEGELSADPNVLPCLLQKLGTDGSVAKGPPGYQVKYHVDPAFLKPGEGRLFIQHVSQQTLHIDIWDGDSLMLIGSSAVDLKHLCRQGRESVQVSYELDVMATEYVESEIPIPAGDQSRDGLVRPVNSNTILKGRLHLRLANIGHPADPSLTRTERAGIAAKPKVVITSDSDVESRYAGGSLLTPPAGPHATDLRPIKGDHGSVLRKTKVAKAAHMAEIDHELASVLFTRKEKISSTDTDTNKAQKRKLARMEAVRHAANEAPQTISTYRQEKEERARDLKMIALYRSQNKREGILNMLNSAITSEHTIHPSLGTTEFFEFVLCNPYNVQHTVIVDTDNPELMVVTNPREWRHFKMVNEIYSSVEEGMFNTNTQSLKPEIFLRPKERVSIPFKFLTFKADHTVHPQAPADPYRSAPKTKTIPQHLKKEDPLESTSIKVFFKTHDDKPIAILSLRVEPQPHVIDQTFRFHHPEQSFLKKSVRLPPLHTLPGVQVGGPGVSQIFVRCSDPNVICESRQVQQGEPHDVFMKVACGASPQVKKFFLALYTDAFLSRPLQIWQVYTHALQRVDIAAIEGQTSRLTLILRGTQASRLVNCFSSHPTEMQIEPREPFMLAANALQEIRVGVRPTVAGTKFLYINVVDIEYHQLVRTWLVCVNCRTPLISKAYELALPVGGGKGSNKRIAYTNPYPHKKIFHLLSNRDDLLQFKDTRLEVGPGETTSIGLRFAPSQAPGTAEILVFINDEDDKNEETFCVRASYQV